MSRRNECFSSGKSEPEEEIDEDITGAPNLFSEIKESSYMSCEEITYDSYFYSSIKDFVRQPKIREHICVYSNDPCDYFEYFFDVNLSQDIIRLIFTGNKSLLWYLKI